ncbi:MAG: hypothetical protein ACRYG8_39200, partial [Janthinobacterium lividum]
MSSDSEYTGRQEKSDGEEGESIVVEARDVGRCGSAGAALDPRKAGGATSSGELEEEAGWKRVTR